MLVIPYRAIMWMSYPTLNIYQREMEYMFTIIKNQKSTDVSLWVDKLW